MTLKVKSELLTQLVDKLYRNSKVKLSITLYAEDWCIAELNTKLEWLDIWTWIKVNEFGHGIQLDKSIGQKLEDLILVIR